VRAQTVVVVQATQYWVRDKLFIHLRLSASHKAGHEAFAGCVSGSGEWQVVQGAVTLPVDATGFWILLRTLDASTYYVDDVRVAVLPEVGVYQKEDDSGGTLWDRSIYDGLGRLVQEQAERDENLAVVSHRAYDEMTPCGRGCSVAG
jgi:hypothetical protein